MNKKRCAIYTRKSHAEGLEQDFNSLDAQREACEAFIKSQVHEGWQPLKDRYDDGAYSGGNLERPALQKLLEDVRANKVQVIVVYKVDRLTRSLADFAKLIELFDQQEVSFVSVTQQFNTTSSMGRLTLNVLLSFAQFEREITGERIRDKFAASKQKGMWMGGNVPLGYDAKERQLVINENEAQRVNYIFDQYLALKNVRQLKEHLDRLQVFSKTRKTQNGVVNGGIPFSRGGLYKILNNPIFIGKIRHKDKIYEGLHQAIINDDKWDKVQTLLTKNNQIAKNGLRVKEPSLLAGKLFDDNGNPMSPSHAVKNKKRYRYYTSQALLKQEPEKAGSLPRIPAIEIEDAVMKITVDFLNNPTHIINKIENGDEHTESIIHASSALKDKVTNQETLLKNIVEKVTLNDQSVEIQFSNDKLCDVLNLPPNLLKTPLTVKETTHLKRSQGENKFILDGNKGESISQNPSMLKALSRAWVWNQMLLNKEVGSISELARMESVTPRYIRKILTLIRISPREIIKLLECKNNQTTTLSDLHILTTKA